MLYGQRQVTIMDKSKAKRILLENQKRLLRKEKLVWESPRFQKQNNFINCTDSLIAVQCTRRAGKSYGAGLKLFKAAYETPNCSVLYVAKTRQSAKNIMCKDILSKINREKNLGAVFNKSELTFTLPNGSVIYLLGIDNSEEEAEKLLGQKFKLVVIDEAAVIQRDLYKVIYSVLKPAVADYNGQIVMISTTSDLLNSFYYKVTAEGYPGWTVMKWGAGDNPFMKEVWAKEIKELKKNNPRIHETPHFRRMYLNEWVIDTESIIYRYDATNIVDSIPSDINEYILGVDLGWDDPTAFSVCGYNEDRLYVIETYKKSKMLLTTVADKIKELESKYGKFTKIVIDGAAKQSVEEMRARYGINFTPAEKLGKKDHIEMMNTELAVNRVMLLEHGTEPLRAEWDGLVWDERAKLKGKYKEHPACPNHLSDATLYAYWYAYTYFFNDNLKVEPKEYIEPTSERAVDKFWEQAEQDVLRKKHTPQDWLEDGLNDGDEWL